MCFKCQAGRQRNGLGDGKAVAFAEWLGCNTMNCSFPGPSSMGCHTQQENDALVLSPQSEHGAGSKAVGRAREQPMDFRVRSLHSNPKEAGEQTHCSVDGASWEGAVDAGSLLCLAPGALAQAPPSPFSPGIPETWHSVCGAGFRVSAEAVFPAT